MLIFTGFILCSVAAVGMREDVPGEHIPLLPRSATTESFETRITIQAEEKAEDEILSTSLPEPTAPTTEAVAPAQPLTTPNLVEELKLLNNQIRHLNDNLSIRNRANSGLCSK